MISTPIPYSKIVYNITVSALSGRAQHTLNLHPILEAKNSSDSVAGNIFSLVTLGGNSGNVRVTRDKATNKQIQRELNS